MGKVAAAYTETVLQTVAHAKQLSIPVLTMHLSRGVYFTLPEKKGLALLLESAAFALTFDIGHNAGVGGSDEAIIMRHKDRLCHMHMHDAMGKSSHLPLGAGELDLPKYLYLASTQKCRVVLDTKTITGLKESVAWLKNNMKGLSYGSALNIQ